MLDYKTLFGIAGLIIGFLGYIPYFRDLFKGNTKPHVFSWFVWGLLTGIAFFAQLAAGGGIGSWVTGMAAVLCLAVAVIALFRGEKNITTIDWLCFIGALLGVVAWVLTKDPTWAVVLVTVVDFVAFIPTFRKSFLRPHEETVTEYVTSSIKFTLAILALRSYSLATWLYPASLILTNGAFAVMTYMRRKHLREATL